MSDKNFEDRFNEKPSSFPNIGMHGRMRHCVYCERDVRPVKRPSIILLAVLVVLSFFFTLVGVGLIALYLFYYVFLQRKECPICRGKNFRFTEQQRSEWSEIKRTFTGK